MKFLKVILPIFCFLFFHGFAQSRCREPVQVPPLSTAAQLGNLSEIESLLASGADPNLALLGNETPLHTAARTGLPKPVRALLTAGAEVNAKTDAGQTPLMWAAADGNAQVVRQLIEAGASTDDALPSGFTAWHFAARNGHQRVIETLRAHGVEIGTPIKSKTKNWGKRPPGGTTALQLAINNGHYQLAIRLLELGADPNDQASGFTPLHILTWVRKPSRGDNIAGAPPPTITGSTNAFQLVDALIAHGADINAKLTRGGENPKVLGRPGATPFLLASQTADLPLMRHYLKHGADPNLPNNQNRTPLMAAAGIGVGPEADEASTENEALAAVQFLLDLGADPTHTDKFDNTLLHCAAFKQAPKLATLLYTPESAAAKNHRGWTPMMIAQGSRYGNYKPSAPTIAALEKAGAELQLGLEE